MLDVVCFEMEVAEIGQGMLVVAFSVQRVSTCLFVDLMGEGALLGTTFCDFANKRLFVFLLGVLKKSMQMI